MIRRSGLIRGLLIRRLLIRRLLTPRGRGLGTVGTSAITFAALAVLVAVSAIPDEIDPLADQRLDLVGPHVPA